MGGYCVKSFANKYEEYKDSTEILSQKFNFFFREFQSVVFALDDSFLQG